MPKKKGVRIAVLVEDRLLDGFARKTLENLGYHPREIRIVPGYPKEGHGSGKQWVEKHYPEEAKTLRQKQGSQSIGLLVGTDADQMTIEQRADQLAAALVGAGLGPRGSQERIAHWIPRWSIETWGLTLTGKLSITPPADLDRNEDLSYKRKPVARDIDWKAASKKFAEEFRQDKRGETVSAIPSLLTAYRETRRLDT